MEDLGICVGAGEANIHCTVLLQDGSKVITVKVSDSRAESRVNTVLVLHIFY